MSETGRETAVIGAGVVGIAAALHLQRAGFDVTLIDGEEPGSQTSFGNAGIVCGRHYVPTAMPRAPMEILRLALNRATYARYQPAALPGFAGWLFAFWQETGPRRLYETARRMMPAMAETVALHRGLLNEADAAHLLRETGWLMLYRDEEDYAEGAQERAFAREAGIPFDDMDCAAACELEPNLSPVFSRAVNWRANASVRDPFAVSQAYLGLFMQAGGTLRQQNVTAIHPDGARWRVVDADGARTFDKVVLCAGVWSADLLAPLGYRPPLKPKRGYHTHYAPQGNASLGRPVVDDAMGFVLAQTTRGIRVTTGIELAGREAPASRHMAQRIEPLARELFPLAEALDDEPWMGRRPAFPDSLPIVGPAPRHSGLWVNFGHAHLGLTLAPLTGRLLAEMMTGERPLIDPSVFDPRRYLR